MSKGALFQCHCYLLSEQVLWALSNYLVLPLVKLLGIGLGFSLYHFVPLGRKTPVELQLDGLLIEVLGICWTSQKKVGKWAAWRKPKSISTCLFATLLGLMISMVLDAQRFQSGGPRNRPTPVVCNRGSRSPVPEGIIQATEEFDGGLLHWSFRPFWCEETYRATDLLLLAENDWHLTYTWIFNGTRSKDTTVAPGPMIASAQCVSTPWQTQVTSVACWFLPPFSPWFSWRSQVQGLDRKGKHPKASWNYLELRRMSLQKDALGKNSLL